MSGAPDDGRLMDMTSREHPAPAVVVAEPLLMIMLVCVAGGALLGGLAELVWEWTTTQPWGPHMGPTRVLAVVPAPWPTVIAAAVGAMAGFLLGTDTSHESLSVTVSADRVLLKSKNEQQRFTRDEIGRAFKDADQLVLLDRTGHELTRQNCPLKPRHLSRAFTEHGYPWT